MLQQTSAAPLNFPITKHNTNVLGTYTTIIIMYTIHTALHTKRSIIGGGRPTPFLRNAVLAAVHAWHDDDTARYIVRTRILYMYIYSHIGTYKV